MARQYDLNLLIAGVQQGDTRSIARAISMIEDETDQARELLPRLFDVKQNAWIVGITGPPGSGKSTLTAVLAKRLAAAGNSIGILAVDPSSPFTGGAILGDRIRMSGLELNPAIYIRSMGTRGSLGGLAGKTAEALSVLQAAGKDIIIIETVGVGQSEIDIINVADTVLLVSVPGLGDDIQTIKAGLMEIGDIHVVNKADRPGAERTVAELESMLAMNYNPEGHWDTPVLRTVAYSGEGAETLLQKMQEHKEFIRSKYGHARLRKRAKDLLDTMLGSRLLKIAQQSIGQAEMDCYYEEIATAESNPCSIVQGICDKILAPGISTKC